MRSIQLHLTIPDRTAAAVYTILASAGAPGASGSPQAAMLSDWPAGSPDLDRTGHGMAVFGRSWSCVDDGVETAVTFATRLDLGDRSQADTSEPRAALTLVDDTVATLSGLFEGKVRVDDIVIQAQGRSGNAVAKPQSPQG